jgi:hypothetical protein
MSAKAYVKVTTGLWKQVNKIYVKVTPTLWKSVNKVYVKVASTLWKSSFGSNNEPVQITRPKLTGTGRVGTTVTRSSGTYSNYNSLVTKIFYTTEVAEQISASTVDPSGGNVTSTNPYTITEYDANPPPYYFYARDEVVGVDNETYYYYSTPPIEAQVPSLSDDFNRTVSVGLGTASGGFTYGGPSRGNATWSVNGSRAVNSSGSLGNNPMKTVDAGSFDQSVSVDTFGGGLGAAVWVASTSSFWSVVPDYTYILNPGDGFVYRCSTNLTTIYDSNEDCPPLAILGSNPQSEGYTFSDVGLRCSPCTQSTENVTTYPCTLPATSYSCPDTGPLGGDRCTSCQTSSSYPCTGSIVTTSTCPDFGSIGGDRCTACTENATITEELTCSGSGSGSTCPGTGSLAGQRCGACNSVAVCTGSQVSTTCPDTGPNVGDRCGSCSGEPETVSVLTCSGSDSSTSCPGTGSLAGQRCGACNSFASCSGATTTSSCPDTGPNVGDRCGACSTNIDSTTSITCSGSGSGGSCPSTGSSVGQRCSSCSSSTSTSNLCTGSTSSASCPSTGPQAGDRCGACSASTSTSYSCTGSGTFASTQTTGGCSSARVGLACALTGTSGTGDRLRYNYTICQANSTTTNTYAIRQSVTTTTYSWSTNASQTTTTTSYSYSVRVQAYTYSINAYQNQTVTYYTYAIRQQGYTWPTKALENVTTYTYTYQVRDTALGYTYNKRDTVTEEVTTKTYYAVEEVSADVYTYYSELKLYQFVNASPTLIDSKIIATFENDPGLEFNTVYYIPINSVQAETSGNTITATGQTSSSSGSVSYVYSGSKGTYVGIIAMAAVTNQGSTLDNFSA